MNAAGSPPDGSLRHLVRRFVWSLRSHEPDPHREAWLMQLCSPQQRKLYHTSSRQDRCHAVECAITADELIERDPQLASLDEETRDQVVVAAALHDVGKTPAKLSTVGRVAATIVKPVVRERLAPTGHEGLWARFGVYKAHPVIGARLLDAADSDPLVVAWAREHHVEPTERTIEPALARILERADD